MTSLKDIAKATGYGISTVSSVISGKAEKFGIKADTVKKITEAADALGYCRNDIAAQMQSGISNTFIFLLPTAIGNYFAEGVLSASDIAERSGYFIKPLYFSEQDDFSKIMQKIIRLRPAAIFSLDNLGPCSDIFYASTSKYKIPTVSLDFLSEQADCCVLTDDQFGITQAVDHIIKLGHHRIAHVTSPLKAQFARRRYELYRDALKISGLELHEDICFYGYDNEQRNALFDFLTRVMESCDPPTLITCGNDYIALDVMMYLLQLGIRIPQDASVMGYGGLRLTKHTVPLMTTIHQPWDELTACAITAMCKKLQGKKIKKTYYVSTTFKVAESTERIQNKDEL